MDAGGAARCAVGAPGPDLERLARRAALSGQHVWGEARVASGAVGAVGCARPLAGGSGGVLAAWVRVDGPAAGSTSELRLSGNDPSAAELAEVAPVPGAGPGPVEAVTQRLTLRSAGAPAPVLALVARSSNAVPQATSSRWWLLLLLGGGSGGLAWLVAQPTLLRPLSNLAARLAPLTAGDVARPAGGDELARLDQAYAQMAESLRRRDAELRVTLADLSESLGFRLLVQTVQDYAIYMLDPGGRVVSWNEGAERIKGYRRGDIVGQPFAVFYTPEDQAAGHPARDLEQALARGHVEAQAMRVRQDGSRFWASVTTTAIRNHDGTLRGFSQVTRDLTERRLAEETLRHLSQRLLLAQEDERRRIARELHDEVGQVLTSVKFSLQWLQRELGPAAPVQRLDTSVANVDRAIAGVRDLSLQLRPTILDELGLVSALRWYVDRFAQQSQLALELDLEPFEERLPLEVEVGCFRVAQEALTNVLRHAQATRVQVELERRAGRLELRVRDDGRGFDAAAVQARAARGECAGLSGMRERVSLSGGTLALESEPGRGSLVSASFPLPTVDAPGAAAAAPA